MKNCEYIKRSMHGSHVWLCFLKPYAIQISMHQQQLKMSTPSNSFNIKDQRLECSDSNKKWREKHLYIFTEVSILFMTFNVLNMTHILATKISEGKNGKKKKICAQIQ